MINHFYKFFGTVLFAFSPFALAAVEADELLEIKYDWSVRENASPQQVSGTCPIYIVPTQDARQNKETIGGSLRGPLLTGDVSPWVTDGLMNLKGFGFSVAESKNSVLVTSGVTVKTVLTRAYTWQVGLKIFSMVALKAEFIDKNGVLQQKYYRAHGDKTNMWGASSEYVTTLNYGLNNLLPAVARDLVSLCKGEKVEAYTYAGPEEVAKK